jgi:hypothetical protein
VSAFRQPRRCETPNPLRRAAHCERSLWSCVFFSVARRQIDGKRAPGAGAYWHTQSIERATWCAVMPVLVSCRLSATEVAKPPSESRDL